MANDVQSPVDTLSGGRNSVTRAWEFPLRLLLGRTARQVFALFGSALFLRAFSLITAPITTRILGPHAYGQLALYGSITDFMLTFFGAGIFSTAGMLLANTRDRAEQRSLIGAIVVAAGLVGLSYSASILALSFFVDKWFHASIGSLLRGIFPFLLFFPMANLVPQIGRGINRIDTIVWAKTFPVVVGVGVVVGLWLSGHLTLGVLIPFRASLAIFPFFLILWVFKPTFAHLRPVLRRLWQKNREFGIHLYMGLVAEVSASGLGQMLIPLFVGPAELGFYALVSSLASPVSGFCDAFALSKYRQYAEWDRIPKRILVVNHSVLMAGCLGLILFGPTVLRVIAGDEFLAAVPLIFPIALAELVTGAYRHYRSFLSAKACGKWMRNASFVLMIVSMVGNACLVPTFGAYGAAWAKVLSLGSFFAANYYYYRRFCAESAKKQ
jgi:O-antigen/teichoic acid export membrane protein